MKIYGFVAQPNGNNRGPDALLLRALNDRLTKRDSTLFFAEVGSNRFECFMLTRLLRVLVDTWIDSAREKGVESPGERQPWREPLEDWWERNPPALTIDKHGLAIFVGSLPAAHDDGKSVSWFARHVEQGLSQMTDSQPHDATFWKALHVAADPATQLYLQMLDSPISTRLFRCKGCPSYFVRLRTRKKGSSIKRGTWCSKCKGKASKERTDESRENRTYQMIEWAADAWMRWKPDLHQGQDGRAEWVARKVNEQMPESWEHLKKTNWVNRHTKEIEAEVQRRKHAKG